MKDFFNKLWVQIVAWAFVIIISTKVPILGGTDIGNIVKVPTSVPPKISTKVPILGGTDIGDIVKVPTLVFGIVEAVGILIIFIKNLLQKKDTANK